MIKNIFEKNNKSFQIKKILQTKACALRMKKSNSQIREMGNNPLSIRQKNKFYRLGGSFLQQNEKVCNT